MNANQDINHGSHGSREVGAFARTASDRSIFSISNQRPQILSPTSPRTTHRGTTPREKERTRVQPRREERAETKIFHVLPIPVEGNSQGCSITKPYPEKPQDEWMPYFIREAPFEVAEVLEEADHVEVKAGLYTAVLVDVLISADALPGLYEGEVAVTLGEESVKTPFSLVVHATVVTDYDLEVTNWFWAQPENLTTGAPTEWWSEAHWQLIENSARTLLAYGQKVILTQNVEGEHPLVQTRVRPDGSYGFDFSRFERWVGLFLGLGFKKIEGGHLTSRTGVHSKAVFAKDEATGETKQIFRRAVPPSDEE